MERHWLASLVEYQEARTSRALVDATNEDLLSRSHCGVAALAGFCICDFADSRCHWKRRSKLLCTFLGSSEALRFKASRSRCVIAWRRSGYHDGQQQHRPRGATTCEFHGAADQREGMPCCPRPRDHRLAPAVLCMSALHQRFLPSSATPGTRNLDRRRPLFAMTRSLVCGMPVVATMQVNVMRRT